MRPASKGRPRIYDGRERAAFYVRPDQKRDLRAWARKVGLSASAAITASLVAVGAIRP